MEPTPIGIDGPSARRRGGGQGREHARHRRADTHGDLHLGRATRRSRARADIAALGAGAYAENRIATDGLGEVTTGDGATGIGVGEPLSDGDLRPGSGALVARRDSPPCHGGVAISIGLSIAINEVDDRTEAAILNAGDGVRYDLDPAA